MQKPPRKVVTVHHRACDLLSSASVRPDPNNVCLTVGNDQGKIKSRGHREQDQERGTRTKCLASANEICAEFRGKYVQETCSGELKFDIKRCTLFTTGFHSEFSKGAIANAFELEYSNSTHGLPIQILI